jgi:putative MATE family efflux protein
MADTGNLTIEPISILIRRIAVPASIGFFFNTLYNVVDTFYTGLLSTQALAAMSLSFPIYFLVIALGSGFSTGAGALMANSLGANDKRGARFVATQFLSLNLILSIVLMILGPLVSPFLFRILGASDAYLQMAMAFTNVIFLGTIFFFASFALNSFLTAQGNTKVYRNVLILGFFLNAIFDPIFMLGGFGIPALGIAGVAWATVTVQIISTILMAYYVSKTGLFCRECLAMFRPRWHYYRQILKQGLPASLNMVTVAIGVFVITYFISWFGKEAVAAYGISTRIDQMAMLPSIGLNIAVLTLVGQNNGAKKFDRVREAIKKGIIYGLGITAVGILFVLIFARSLMGVFSNDQTVINIGVTYLRISVLTYFAYLILYITVSALQGLKQPMYAIWIGLYRQIILPLLLFFILVRMFTSGLVGVWWGIFIINWSATIITIFYLRRVIKKTLTIN